jgi:hypothetical protein
MEIGPYMISGDASLSVTNICASVAKGLSPVIPMLNGTSTFAALPLPTQPGSSKIVTPPGARTTWGQPAVAVAASTVTVAPATTATRTHRSVPSMRPA